MAEHSPFDPRATPQLADHRDALYRYLLGLVRDREEAEDLTQETLLRAHRKLSSLVDEALLVPWLYKVATNVARDRFRQTSYRHRPEPLAEDDDERTGSEVALAAGPRLDKLLEQREMGECVRGYLERLSEPHRAAILLHDVEGLTNPEIAEMLDVSLATVKIRVHRARNELRAVLGSRCSFTCDERGVRVCVPK
jgi:RNA polymerase sigma-70 factor (ECF subfamily)